MKDVSWTLQEFDIIFILDPSSLDPYPEHGSPVNRTHSYERGNMTP